MNSTTDKITYNLYFACNILKYEIGAIISFSVNAALILNAKAAKLAGVAKIPQRKKILTKKNLLVWANLPIAYKLSEEVTT